MEFVRRFSDDLYTRALEDWQWLADLGGKTPIVASAFGDIFLRGADGVWFLDTLEGSLSRYWDATASLQEQLNTAEGQDRFLMTGLVAAATEKGLIPGDTQVLSFKVAPVLGGPIDVENLEVSDLVVALSVAGQIHRQVADLPPGTSISGVTLDEK